MITSDDHRSLIAARLGTIFMVVTLSGNLEAAFSAWIGGRFFDLTGSYALTFATAIAGGLLAIGCMWAGRSQSLVPSPSGRGVG
jgi:cyanate permease